MSERTAPSGAISGAGIKRLVQSSNIRLNSNSYDYTIHHCSGSSILFCTGYAGIRSGASGAAEKERRNKEGRTPEKRRRASAERRRKRSEHGGDFDRNQEAHR